MHALYLARVVGNGEVIQGIVADGEGGPRLELLLELLAPTPHHTVPHSTTRQSRKHTHIPATKQYHISKMTVT